ncbi:mitochondrial import inner membrane translocase subunit Tim54 [Ampelomyces quisqualis]|uniref:Mitochondrial import inner membrane translocase subunit TIM54 n=1 Tax=Ampelomyces quisqualis TaxID=50730 RepID=A0A6A5Q8J0_AMPQU|nr:mitochondrial import inner membrane translocase subunit Tim54 [Ampelomyces quisqualis]
MAEPGANVGSAHSGPEGAPKAPRPPNPVWRMMGLPNFRFKLPSRNWIIFLSITGSWTAAMMYDRREQKRIQRKWARLVEHIAHEPLDTQQLPRKLTIYVSAPPADGLVPARDHFHEYVKPILVAAALDWDAVEGRREGDVRAGLAERIRKLRKRRGEPTTEPLEEGLEESLAGLRQRAGVREWDGPSGDIVIGRHTWKEYVRGLHEGWLGPLDHPARTIVPTPLEFPVPQIEDSTSAPGPIPSIPEAEPVVVRATDDAAQQPIADTPALGEGDKAKEDESKPKKKKQPPALINPTDYHSATLSQNCPQALGPAAVVPFPHLLGFFNFPIRIYRFLNKRHVADEIGRQTAAAVLGVYRPFHASGEMMDSSANGPDSSSQCEQQQLLVQEEADYHKTARDRSKDEEGKERVWLDDMILDTRIAERMRRFVLDAEAEEAAARMPREKTESWFGSLWPREHKKGGWEGLGED